MAEEKSLVDQLRARGDALSVEAADEIDELQGRMRAIVAHPLDRATHFNFREPRGAQGMDIVVRGGGGGGGGYAGDGRSAREGTFTIRADCGGDGAKQVAKGDGGLGPLTEN